ncbi:hypothetical protein [[Scytonema hofmanni] UTEX B 1581]|uniref:hypothetical protein n=1 Tax=[Scytonema hofmanni] UTEX B 1581 TaxID=379535 RepID=UPI0011840E49|nr:hypothetical protein [[Scytonema hofmanni] UTEX B 1581]
MLCPYVCVVANSIRPIASYVPCTERYANRSKLSSKYAHSHESFYLQKFIYNSHQWVRTGDRLFIYNWVELDDAVFYDTLFPK